MMASLGKIVYETYWTWDTPTAKSGDYRPWYELHTDIRACWEASARAVARTALMREPQTYANPLWTHNPFA